VHSDSKNETLKVGTHVETSPCNQTPEEFTRRDWSQGLVPRTVHTKRSEEQVAGTCPKNSNWFEFVGLVAGTNLWSLLLDFEAKMASSHDGTYPRDLLQGLVAGTGPLVFADL